ncbi:hypothetical protein DSO57_1030402 [Entomophthora muscae]|uniref:Uncharacterized protein n=1 Tax=Entomophthora muscae TaxID=34485 RepID=A0ACC2S2T7_9FUNG|nr:hypothetical protein DSO57_1030402 [Entomophthora muscae]
MERIPARGKSRLTLPEQEKLKGRALGGKKGMVSGLIILSPWKPGPGSQIQTLTLDSLRPLALWTKGPPAFLCFLEFKPLQADTKNAGPNGKASQTKEISAPNGGPIKAPNRRSKILAISFMSLKSTLVANQEPSPEGGMSLWPDPITTTLEQDNQVANLRFLTNEKTPGLSAILPPLNPSTQISQAHLS